MSQPPPPPSGQPSQPPGAGGTADVAVRFIAKLIDGVVLTIAMFVVSLALSPLFASGFAFTGGQFSMTGFTVGAFVINVVSAAIAVGYFAFMESSRGQTIGKMVLKLQVQGPDGGHPSMESAIKRNAWALLSIIPWFGGLLQLAAVAYIGYTIYDNQANVGWHDEFAGGTRVVRVG